MDPGCKDTPPLFLPPTPFLSSQISPKTKDKIYTYVHVCVLHTHAPLRGTGMKMTTSEMQLIYVRHPASSHHCRIQKKTTEKTFLQPFSWLTLSAKGNGTYWISLFQRQLLLWQKSLKTHPSFHRRIWGVFRSMPCMFPCWPHKMVCMAGLLGKARQCPCTIAVRNDPKSNRQHFCLLWRWISSAMYASRNYWRNTSYFIWGMCIPAET